MTTEALSVDRDAATPRRGTRPLIRGRSRSTLWRRAISPLAILGIWQLASSTGAVAADKFPSPSTIAHTGWQLITNGQLFTALQISLQRAAIGFVLGAVAALVLAVVAGLWRLGEDLIDPPIQMLRTLPLLGLMPLFIVWFGVNETPKVLMVALAASFPMYLNTFAAIRGVDPKLLELARTLRLSWTARLRYVVLPAALPQTLVGVRQSLGISWIALIVAEQLGADSGIGFMINNAEQFLENDVIIFVLVVYAFVGLLTDTLVRLIERRALAWRVGTVVR
jgi:sulfonate transport system permease protein